MSKNSKVIQLCGEYPKNFTSINLDGVQNFIFEDDPNFEVVTLFDIEMNVASVNSFIECEHYVTGGWDYIPNEKLPEPFFHNLLILFSLVGFAVIYFIFNPKFKFRK